MKNRFFEEIEILRAFAIIAVISIHISMYYKTMEEINLLTTLYMSICSFSQFAVPLFVTISGFTLYNKYYDDFSISSFYRKRFISIIPSYLVFSTAYILLETIYMLYIHHQMDLNISSILLKYLTGNGYYHLWFFILIIQLYLFYPVTLRVFEWAYRNGCISLFLFSLLVCTTLYGLFHVGSLDVLGPFTYYIGYLVWFVIGMICLRNYSSIKAFCSTNPKYFLLLPSSLFSTGILLAWGYQYFEIGELTAKMYIYTLLAPVISPAFYSITFYFMLVLALSLIKMHARVSRFLQLLGKYSFGIYLIHVVFSLIIN